MRSSFIGLTNALEMFRVAGGRDIPIQLLIIFLQIAEHDGILQQSLVKLSGMSEASVSRMVDWLGDEHRSGKSGLRLIRKERDPEFYKRWKLFLTPKGQQVAALMIQQLNTED